jgi:CHAT domain-containing protein
MKIEIKKYFGSIIICFFVFYFSAGNAQPNTSLKKADAFLELPDYNQGLLFLNKTISDCTVNDQAILSEALIKRARVYLAKSENTSAKNDLLKAIEKCKERKSLEEFRNLIECYYLLGNLNVAIGDIETAGNYYKQCQTLITNHFPKDNELLALTYRGLSTYHGFKLEIDSEYYYANQAYLLLPQLNKKSITSAEILMRYAYAYKVKFREGKDGYLKCYPIVRDLYQQALAILDGVYSKPSVQKASALHALGNSYADFIHSAILKNPKEKQNCFDKAKEYYSKDLALKKIISGYKSSDYSVSCYTMALLHQANNDTSNALLWYNKAISCINEKELQLQHLTGDERLNTSDPYSLNILLTNRNSIYTSQYQNNPDKVLLEKIHASNLERIILWRQLFATHQSKDLGSVIAIWNHAPFEETINSAYLLYEATSDKKFLNDIFNFAEESKNNDFLRELIQKKKSSVNKNELLPQNIKLETLKSFCKNNHTAFIEISSNKAYGNSSYVIVVDEQQLAVYPFTASAADSLLDGLRLAMKTNNIKAYENYAFEVYRLVLEKPLQKITSTKNLIISPSGDFNDLSFEALVNKKCNNENYDFRKLNYFLHQYSISYALSGTVLNYQTTQERSPSKNISAFFATINDKADLLFSKKLFERLSNEYDGNFYSADKVNLKSFLDNAKSQQVLQLFSHAKADKNNYENTTLFLSNSDKEGLTISCIYDHTFKSDLTILACCESGAGLEKYGEGVKSLVRAFTFSGSKAVIGTLWSVDEKSTISILDEFYNLLSDKFNLSTRLQTSKKQYIERCKSSDAANPFYWAGLVVNGDATTSNTITLSSNSSSLYTIGFFTVFSIVLIFIFLVLKRLKK